MKGGTTDLTSSLEAALKAVGTTVGVLGFVTFAGASLLWLRFEALDMPAAYAITAVPHDKLVTTGAALLAPACVVALAAGTFLTFLKVFLISRAGRTDSAWLPNFVRTWLQEITAAQQELTDAHADERVKIRTWQATREALAGTPVEQSSVAETQLAQLRSQALAATQARRDAEARVNNAERLGANLGTVLMFVATTIVAIYFVIVDDWKVFLLAAAAGVVASAAGYLILARTSSVLWSIVGLFAAAAIYAVFLQAARTYLRPRIEPVALVVKSAQAGQAGKPKTTSLTGGLVGETSDVIYIAVPEGGPAWAVRRIERSNVTQEAIGALTPKKTVVAEAKRLLAKLTR